MRLHFKGGSNLSEGNHAGLVGMMKLGGNGKGWSAPNSLHQPKGVKCLAGHLGNISPLVLLPERDADSPELPPSYFIAS